MISNVFAQAKTDADDKMKVCMAQANVDCTNWVTKFQGGEFPHGISINTVVELSEGEKYYLDGQIEIHGETPYLKIDLDKQPWLKNKIRKSFPYYRIDDDVKNWKKWNSLKVELLVEVQSVAFVDPSNHKVMNEFILTPLQAPVSNDSHLTRFKFNKCK